MKVIREKKSIFIEAETNEEFERKINESLNGLVTPDVQVYGLYKAAILYDEVTYEDEEKTITELFEEAGCGAKCSECPYFEKPTDGRKKWYKCTRGNRKVKEDSRACESYYLRKEGKREIPKSKTGNESAQMESAGHRKLSRHIRTGILQQTEQTQLNLLTFGEETARGSVQGS